MVLLKFGRHVRRCLRYPEILISLMKEEQSMRRQEFPVCVRALVSKCLQLFFSPRSQPRTAAMSLLAPRNPAESSQEPEHLAMPYNILQPTSSLTSCWFRASSGSSFFALPFASCGSCDRAAEFTRHAAVLSFGLHFGPLRRRLRCTRCRPFLVALLDPGQQVLQSTTRAHSHSRPACYRC